MDANRPTPLNIGLIGAGNISPTYIKGCRTFDILNLIAISDLDVNRAQSVAAEHSIPKALSVDELLADPEIDIVINLTVPKAHAEVSIAALNAGKHVYSEKPLATNRADGERIMTLAAEKELLVGCAPDTFMFAQHQTVRKLLDEGVIGRPVAAVAHMAGHGMETWHPNPDFFYQPGAGPLFDMGPYYITCLVHLLGAVTRVASSSQISFSERVVTSAGNNGRRIPVNTPTHVAGVLDFEGGAVGTLITSFDIWAHHLPLMEIYGSEGTLSVPDPNGYINKDIRVYRHATGVWEEAPSQYPEAWMRGIGTADMAYALCYGRAHRASGALAYHVLEVMEALLDSSVQGQHIAIQSRIERPPLLPTGLAERTLDARFA